MDVSAWVHFLEISPGRSRAEWPAARILPYRKYLSSWTAAKSINDTSWYAAKLCSSTWDRSDSACKYALFPSYLSDSAYKYQPSLKVPSKITQQIFPITLLYSRRPNSL